MQVGIRTDHLSDDIGRARVLDLVRLRTTLSRPITVVAGSVAIVILHHAWVTDPIIGSRHTDAATGFLDHDGENKAVVNLCCGCNRLYGVIYSANFWAGVIGDVILLARMEHDRFVIIEPVQLFRLDVDKRLGI